MKLQHIILYCRQGFEKECASEINAVCSSWGIFGFIKAQQDSGFVVFTASDPQLLENFVPKLFLNNLTFTRQFFFAFAEITGLKQHDRISPIVSLLKEQNITINDVAVETADTNAAKEILPFCKKFTPLIIKALSKDGMVNADSPNSLHLFFLSSTAVYAGIVPEQTSSPWYMGIPRLKFPKDAPSRSTLKLEEAFFTFLTNEERITLLSPSKKAIDLGAAPGGWSYQFARRGMHVIAVDNGPMHPSLLESGLVHHKKADGFTYMPQQPVEWMVCDIVEQPSKIAALIGHWMASGLCRRSIFNLKLPMKKRFEEIIRCRNIITAALGKHHNGYTLSIKQLYHDREEVTGYIYQKNR